MGVFSDNNIGPLLYLYNMMKMCQLFSPVFLQLALEYGIKFMETSAKANINVENVCSHSSLNYNMLNRSYVINITTCVFVLFHRHF